MEKEQFLEKINYARARWNIPQQKWLRSFSRLAKIIQVLKEIIYR